MVDQAFLQFMIRPLTKKDKFFRWLKRHILKIIAFLIITIIGILVFMYQTVWKYEWEYKKTRIENLKLLYEEIEYNNTELEVLRNGVVQIKKFLDNPKYIKLKKQEFRNLPAIFHNKGNKNLVGDVELEQPKLKNDVIADIYNKGLTLEMLSPQNKHFLFRYDKVKYTNIYEELKDLIIDFNKVYLKIYTHKQGVPYKLGDLEWIKQGKELENELKNMQSKISNLYKDVHEDYKTFLKITNELNTYLKE